MSEEKILAILMIYDNGSVGIKANVRATHYASGKMVFHNDNQAVDFNNMPLPEEDSEPGWKLVRC